MSEQVKSCPFCGKRPVISRGGPSNTVWYIRCDRDIHSVLIQSSETRKFAIEVWNTRPSAPPEARQRDTK